MEMSPRRSTHRHGGFRHEGRAPIVRRLWAYSATASLTLVQVQVADHVGNDKSDQAEAGQTHHPLSCRWQSGRDLAATAA